MEHDEHDLALKLDEAFAALAKLPDLRVLVDDLDALVESARPVPLVRSRVLLDTVSVYAPLDGILTTVPAAITFTRWLADQRSAYVPGR